MSFTHAQRKELTWMGRWYTRSKMHDWQALRSLAHVWQISALPFQQQKKRGRVRQW